MSARKFIFAGIVSALLVGGTASAQLMCGVDLTGDGDNDDPGETASCSTVDLCPIDAVACAAPAPYVCPTVGELAKHCTNVGGTCDYVDPVSPGNTIQQACIVNSAPPTCPVGGRPCVDTGAGNFMCSASSCIDVGAAGGAANTARPREYVIDNGARDAAGACLDQMRIFSGFAMDCKPPGAQTLFKDCCKNRGKIITDDGGGGIGAAGTITGFTAVFSGMSTAYSAFAGGASASAAAGAGAAQIVSFFSPVTLAGAALVSLMVDLLNLGCDAQDMETGVLRGSDMCHEVGDYCSVRLPLIGCIQKSKAHCCFNSKLGRIIQEQGRPQLAAFTALTSLWGTPGDPMCRGFTPEEFQALDFSSMDLSEYFNELALNAQATMQNNVQQGINNYVTTNGVN
jgi:conjugal transfer mating pair stabilization protein TraN